MASRAAEVLRGPSRVVLAVSAPASPPESHRLTLPPPDSPGGAAFALGDWLMGIENGLGGVLHFASTFLIPGFCQFCRLLPRGNEDEGLCAQTTAAP